MKRFFVVALALSLVGMTAAAPAEAGKRKKRNFGFNTFEFTNGNCTSDELDARVQNDAGLDGGRALVLRKACATNTGASVGAQLTGVKGKTVNELGFDFKEEDDCDQGAPRIVVTTETGDTFAFTCNFNPGFGDDPCEDLEDDWQRCRFEEDNAEPLGDASDGFDFNKSVIRSAAIVYDIEGEAAVDNVVFNNCTQNFSSDFRCRVQD